MQINYDAVRNLFPNAAQLNVLLENWKEVSEIIYLNTNNNDKQPLMA